MSDVGRNVRFTPESGHRNSIAQCPLCAKSRHSALQQKALLVDHLVGEGKQFGRHINTERLGDVEIDYQLELGRLQDR